MKDLQQQFIAHWNERGFGTGRGTLLLALSGGIDSMVLAHLLLTAGIPFAAAHCNFGLRGRDADDDADFVQEWCSKHSVICHLEVFDTALLATQRKQSIQVAARELRYQWFEALRLEHHYSGILTAHHADDVAETVLMHLCRGTGIAGLHGIPERNGAIIRPLLFATRNDIADYALAEHISWREDASNQKTDYLRNAFRHKVLPQIEGLMPGASRRMAATALRISDAEAIYRQAIAKRLSRLVMQHGKDWYVPVKLLAKTSQLHTIAYELFTPFQFSPEQLSYILQLMHSESGRSIASATHRIIRHRDFLVITAHAPAAADLILIEELPLRLETADGVFTISWEAPVAEYPDDPNIALLHGDALSLPLVLRTRREGDYFYPLGMGGKKKKLKRFLIDIKMPAHEKDRVRILEWEGKILWIAGKRIDERFKARPSTKRILKIVFQTD